MLKRKTSFFILFFFMNSDYLTIFFRPFFFRKLGKLLFYLKSRPARHSYVHNIPALWSVFSDEQKTFYHSECVFFSSFSWALPVIYHRLFFFVRTIKLLLLRSLSFHHASIPKKKKKHLQSADILCVECQFNYGSFPRKKKLESGRIRVSVC